MNTNGATASEITTQRAQNSYFQNAAEYLFLAATMVTNVTPEPT